MGKIDSLPCLPGPLMEMQQTCCISWELNCVCPDKGDPDPSPSTPQETRKYQHNVSFFSCVDPSIFWAGVACVRKQCREGAERGRHQLWWTPSGILPSAVSHTISRACALRWRGLAWQGAEVHVLQGQPPRWPFCPPYLILAPGAPVAARPAQPVSQLADL